MTRKIDPDHPILPEAWKHEVISFHCEGEGDERYVDLGLRHRETEAITHLRFLGVKDMYFSGAPDSQGLEILDVASRQLEGVSVEVGNFENAPDRVRLLARSVVKLEATLEGATGTSFPPAAVLDPATNRAIVKMPNRRYPGVLLQGDSLHSLRGEVAEVADSIRKGDVDTASSDLGSVVQRLDELLDHYEAVLKRAGFDLPYYRLRRRTPASTGWGPHGYRDFLPFAGAVRTVSAAAMMTATAISLSSDLFNTSARGSTGSSVAGPPKMEAEELQ